MNTVSRLLPKKGHVILAVLTVFLSAIQLQSATLEYNPGQNLGWFDTSSTQWGTSPTYNSNWSNGNTASFSATPSGNVVSFLGNASVAGVTVLNNASITFQASSGTNIMTFSGGTFAAAGSGGTVIGSRVSLTGDLSLTGRMQWTGSTNLSAYAGNLTVKDSNLTYLIIQDSGNRLSTSSNIILEAGSTSHFIQFRDTGTASMGALTINGTGANSYIDFRGTSNLSVTSLTGVSGATLSANGDVAGISNSSLTVNQSTNTTYAGNFVGTKNNGGNTGYLALTKSGAGDLTLSGTISGMAKTTTINGGRLYINGTSTSFGDIVGSTAIQVASGGTLGGTGIVTTVAAKNVVVADGGKLAAGLVGTAGRTTYALGTGAALDLSGVSSATGWLQFDLGANTTAGTTYDQIKLTSGSLAIGSGALNFNDFSFTALSGFGVGTYTLFDTTGISGTLGSSLNGNISGFGAQLFQSGNNLMLTVSAVPEPSVYMLMGLGMAVILIARRRKARKDI